MKTKPTSIRFDEEKLKFFQEKYPNINTPQKVIDHFLDVFWWRHHVTKKYDASREYPLTQNEAILAPEPPNEAEVPKKKEKPALSKKQGKKKGIQNLTDNPKAAEQINTEVEEKSDWEKQLEALNNSKFKKQ